MKKDIKIYQTFHKPFIRNNECKWIVPVGVGGYTEQGFESDSTGENISNLNPYYCELTAQYWAWKNTTTEYVGFCHYRRYFNFQLDQTWKDGYAFETPASDQIINYLTSDSQFNALSQLLNISDIVIPRKSSTPKSIEEHYLEHHIPAHWHTFKEVLKTVYPQHQEFTKLFEMSNLNTVYNMFVMRRDLFNSYCNDLFKIVDFIFNNHGHEYTTYNNRYPGFLAERFLGFWIQINRLSLTEVPVLKID